jgi:hypothetical protein
MATTTTTTTAGPAAGAATVYRMELDKLNRYAEFLCPEMVSGRVQVRLVQGSAWSSAVLQFHGSVSDDTGYFDELDTTNRLSAEGISAKIDLLGVRRLRVVVTTISGTAGAIVEVCFCGQNPYVK